MRVCVCVCIVVAIIYFLSSRKTMDLCLELDKNLGKVVWKTNSSLSTTLDFFQREGP